MNEKSKMAKDQQYKLLSKGEREYVEMTEDELNQKYKRPDLARRQYFTRIKYRVRNAIEDMSWLCNKLTDSQLEKIFLDEYIESLFDISQKALDVKALQKKEILRDHIRNLMFQYYSPSEMKAFDELMIKYSSFQDIQNVITLYLGKTDDFNIQLSFIRAKGLEKQFIEYRSNLLEMMAKIIKEQFDSGKIWEDLKAKGIPEEHFELFRKNLDKLIGL